MAVLTSMKLFRRTALSFVVLSVLVCQADDVLFRDDFKGELGKGWSWVREHREGWRVSARGPLSDGLLCPALRALFGRTVMPRPMAVRDFAVASWPQRWLGARTWYSAWENWR